jgi:predicted esterase
MKKFITAICFSLILFSSMKGFQQINKGYRLRSTEQDTVLACIDLLQNLSTTTDNFLFKLHCSSIINVIQSKKTLTARETALLKSMYTTFTDTNVHWNASQLSSYLARRRPFIVSWISPTDSVVSLAWLLPPEDWHPDQAYPLYVRLHGLNSPYSDPIEYMAFYLAPETPIETTFEDGYSLFPWARGNLWYEGTSETDVWECIENFESMVKIDTMRKYLLGFSMGGYGVLALSQKSADTWAAIGVYSGALSYGGPKYLNGATVQKIKDVPVYIVCGSNDGLLSDNQMLYSLLQEVGNQHISFTTFAGGHEATLLNWQNMYYWIKAFNNDRSVSVSAHVEPQSRFILRNNYPNPYNPETVIGYQIAARSHVELKIFDVLGREIMTLVDTEQDAGTYEVPCNGKYLVGGAYFYRMKAGDFVKTNKMILLK